MGNSTLSDALAHHVWATLQLVDACLALTPEQLETVVPGTYGSILQTQRHLIGADASYLWLLSDGSRPEIEEDRLDLRELRAAMAENGPIWESLLARDLDPDADVVRHRDDGTESHAPRSIRLAQVLHHGTDHRSQICTALTTIGIEPPEIDVWAFASAAGRLSETAPT